MVKNTYNYLSRSFYIDMSDGSKKQIRVYGKTKKELQAKYEQKRLDYLQGRLTLNSNTTFSHWVEEWFEVYKKPTVTTKTARSILALITKVYVSYLGNIKMGEIKTTHLQKCINSLQGSSLSCINKAYYYIRSIMKKAVQDGIINTDPSMQLVKPSGSSGCRRAITDEELKHVIYGVDHHPYGLLIGILLACGLRPGEARALTWDNVDIKQKTVSIVQAVESGTNNRLKEPKSAAGKRSIPIPDWYRERLARSPVRSLHGYVFPNPQGGIITEQHFRRIWRSFFRMIDIHAGAKLYRNEIIEHALSQDITPYYLRHTYATNLAEAGVDMKTAQYLLGHSDIGLTAKVYTHVSDKMKQDASAKINALQTANITAP